MVIRVTIAYDRAKSVVSPFTGEVFIKQIDFFAAVRHDLPLTRLLSR